MQELENKKQKNRFEKNIPINRQERTQSREGIRGKSTDIVAPEP